MDSVFLSSVHEKEKTTPGRILLMLSLRFSEPNFNAQLSGTTLRAEVRTPAFKLHYAPRLVQLDSKMEINRPDECQSQRTK